MRKPDDINHSLDELEGIQQIAEALANKDPKTRLRMMQWAADKFCGCILYYKPDTKDKPL